MNITTRDGKYYRDGELVTADTKFECDLATLKEVGRLAKLNHKERLFVDFAIEWAEASDKEIARLNALLAQQGAA